MSITSKTKSTMNQKTHNQILRSIFLKDQILTIDSNGNLIILFKKDLIQQEEPKPINKHSFIINKLNAQLTL
jgi:hypothetical protein